jgi:hypothetical protein
VSNLTRGIIFQRNFSLWYHRATWIGNLSLQMAVPALAVNAARDERDHQHAQEHCDYDSWLEYRLSFN